MRAGATGGFTSSTAGRLGAGAAAFAIDSSTDATVGGARVRAGAGGGLSTGVGAAGNGLTEGAKVLTESEDTRLGAATTSGALEGEITRTASLEIGLAPDGAGDDAGLGTGTVGASEATAAERGNGRLVEIEGVLEAMTGVLDAAGAGAEIGLGTGANVLTASDEIVGAGAAGATGSGESAGRRPKVRPSPVNE